MIRLNRTFLLVGVLLVLTGPAGAEIPTPVPARPVDPAMTSSEVVEKARTLFREASALGTAGNYLQALRLYEQSNDLVKSASTLYNIGFCYMKLEDPASAWYSTHQALSAVDWSHGTVPSLSSERASEARAQAQLLYDQLVQVHINLSTSARILVDEKGLVRATSGEVVAHSKAGQSEAQWDTSLILLVTPGKHVFLFVDVETGKSERNEVDVIAGRPVTLQFPNHSLVAAPSVSTSVEPTSTEAPLIILTPAAASPPSLESEATSSDLWTNVYPAAQWSSVTVAGLGIVLAVTGAAVYFSADQRLKHECDQYGDCPEEMAGIIKRHHTASVITNVGIWTTALGGIAGLTIYAFKPRSAQIVALKLKRSELVIAGQF